MLFSSLVWAGGEEFTDHETPLALEQELQVLVSSGADQSDDPAQLLYLARMYLDLGYGWYVDQEKKLASFQEGARLAQKALEQQESSVDAHFLYAANLGKAVQLQGLVAAALSLQTLKNHVNRMLELDAEYAPAHHMLGRMYEDLPWFLGGDTEAADSHLKKAISLDTRYAPARLDLGKWYLKHGRSQEAAKEFIRVLNTPPIKKRWIWERIQRPQAQILLRQMRVSESPGPPG
ncbi:MAG: TRAP transporter TatT component family protein [Nitrospirales bacterium]